MIRRRLNTAFPQQSSGNDVSPSIMITVLILAIAVILFASLYLLLRFLRRNRHRDTSSTAALPHSLSSTSPKSLLRVSPEIDSLPLFTYDRLTAKNGGDCAVCLSKFESDDVLRLLPICCHVFPATCIDTWLTGNLTCPLCRSPVFMSDGELLGKLAGELSRSFSVEIGNVSTAATNSDEIRRSYSLGGEFDYVITPDENSVADVTSDSFRRTTSSELYKVVDPTAEQQGALAAEVGTRGGWLKDYLSFSLSSSRTASFRSSGRFFTGSSRRSTVELAAGNRENELVEFDGASRLGDEIGELFRWLSGV